MKSHLDSSIALWNKIKLRTKPSYTVFILAVLFGLAKGNIFGGALALALVWTFEWFFPPKPILSKGLLRNRTKGVINIISITILIQIYQYYMQAAELDSYNSMGRAAGISTEWILGSSQGHRILINGWSFVIAAWLGYQAYIAKRIDMVHYIWVFASFAVIFLPFISIFIGPLWVLANFSLIIVLLVSTFTFRLPQQWPTAVPTPLPAQPEIQVEMIERDLAMIKRLLDSGILSQEEFSSKKQEIFLRYKGEM